MKRKVYVMSAFRNFYHPTVVSKLIATEMVKVYDPRNHIQSPLGYWEICDDAVIRRLAIDSDAYAMSEAHIFVTIYPFSKLAEKQMRDLDSKGIYVIMLIPRATETPIEFTQYTRFNNIEELIKWIRETNVML